MYLFEILTLKFEIVRIFGFFHQCTKNIEQYHRKQFESL